jgi:hypothetical protein
MNGPGPTCRLHHQMVHRRSSAQKHVHIEKENGELIGRLDLKRMKGMEGWQPDRKLLKIIEQLKSEGTFVKLLNLKVPFGTAKMIRVTGAKYLAWEDAFEVDFEDGLTFLEPHETIRKANKISSAARLVRIELDEEPCIGFFAYYDNGQIAEVSWSFVRELAPKSSQK